MAEDNRTEPGTPKKRRETRDRGEVARSMELSASLNLMSGLAGLCLAGAFMYRQLGGFMHKVFGHLASPPAGVPEQQRLLSETLWQAVLALLPVLAAILAVTVLTNYLQIGFYITTQAVMPKLAKINPVNGIKRLVSARGAIELLKAVIKISLTGLIVWWALIKHMPDLISLTGAPLANQLAAAGKLLLDVAFKLGGFFVILGAFDYVWQRYDFEQKLRMTKQEVRDEYRQTEGDPQVKSKMKARHRRLLQTRTAAEVARADVVTTNPTHYAVALRYDYRRMPAPKVVAKGQRLWAKLIVRIARQHQVPVVENKPLTRSLYQTVEVGQEVPPHLYRAVAELMAMIYKMRKRRGVQA